MFIYRGKSHLKMGVLIIMIAISMVACQVFDPNKKDQVLTQDVGEEPPTLFPSSTPDSPTSISIPTQIDDSEPVTMLVGPAPYPSPGVKVVPWEQLIYQSLFAGLNWETYRGELVGIDKSSKWVFSFVYPSGWYSDTQSSLIQGFVQNLPVMQGPASSEFVKFEIVRLTDPPLIEVGHTLNPNDLITVEIAGEPGLLYSVIQQPDQAWQAMVFFQHEGAWLAATGYIALPFANSAALNQFLAVIFIIMSSFTFAEQSAGTILAAPTPGSPIRLEQPFAKTAFQVGPFDFEFYLYQDPGFRLNPSLTWMYSDIPGVGTHVSWVYHGLGLDKTVVESWGICPDISPRDTFQSLKDGDSSIREGGILLPQYVKPGSVVQFVYKVETSQGTFGGVPSFLLAEGAQGVKPSSVTNYPLNQAGRTVDCVSDLQSSLLSQSTFTLIPTLVKKESQPFPSGLSVEEHMLRNAPQVDGNWDDVEIGVFE